MADFDPNLPSNAGLQLEKIFCPACNRDNKLGATFCAHCAAYLGDLEDGRKTPAPGEDALDGLLAKAAEEAAAAPPPVPLPPVPPSDPPPRRKASSETSSVPPEDAGDVLDTPIKLPDGRVVRRASTVSKLEKLQHILGKGGADPGSGGGGGEGVVSYLEKKVAEQAAAIELLRQEKEKLLQEYMSDALDGDDGGGGLNAAVAAERERSRALAEQLKEQQGKRAELAERLLARTEEVAQLKEKVAELKAAGAGAVDPDAIRAAAVAQLRGEIEARSKKAQEQLEAQTRRAQLAEEARDRLIEQVTQVADEARAEVATELEALQHRNKELEGKVAELLATAPTRAGGGPEVAQLKAELERTRAQLGKIGETAKEQVQAVTRYYERILGRVPCGVLVVDSELLVLSINAAALKVLELQAPQVVRKIATTVPELEPLVSRAKKVLETGEEIPKESVSLALKAGPKAFAASAGLGELGTRKVCVVAFQDEPAAPERPSSVPGSDRSTLREDLFALRMLIELLISKATQPKVVETVGKNLLTDVDRMAEALK